MQHTIGANEQTGGQRGDSIDPSNGAARIGHKNKGKASFLGVWADPPGLLANRDGDHDQLRHLVHQLLKAGKLLLARLAPGSPEIEQHRTSAEIGEPDLRCIQALGAEIRSRLAQLRRVGRLAGAG
jgi:hypothetical protein